MKDFILFGAPFYMEVDSLQSAIDTGRESFRKYPRGCDRTMTIYRKVAEIRIQEQIVTEVEEQP